MVGFLFVGLVAYPNLPVAPLPKVDFPTIQVSAQYPGASAETMASSVAQPLERQFAQIPGVAQVTSTSGLANTTVVVQFETSMGRLMISRPRSTQPAASCPGTSRRHPSIARSIQRIRRS
jgi:multidrug efflux pump subunit AcrB